MRKIVYLLCIIILAGTASAQKFRSGVFLHHSTGGNIWGPNGSPTSVPNEIDQYNADNGYFGDDACSLTEQGWPTNPWNNEWSRWHKIFDNEDPNADIRPYLNSNKIIIIKSCFPSSHMTGWGSPSDTLNPNRKTVFNYKWHWRSFLRVMREHPDNFFVVWTNAPLAGGSTDDEEALLAHHFCKWAKDTLATGNDPEIGEFPDNIYVFDFFHKLVGSDWKMKEEYAVSWTDSHPNADATELIAPQFVEEVFDNSIDYEAIYSGTLDPPDLISPVFQAEKVSVNVTLRWSKVTSATGYVVQVARSSFFNDPDVDEFVEDSTFYKLEELDYDTQYFWRVKSVRGSEAESGWSEKWWFTTIIEQPEIPTFVYPPDSTENVDVKPTFKWYEADRADHYRLQVATDTAFQVRKINTLELTDTTYQVQSDELDSAKKYYCRLNAYNDGGESGWSEPITITTIPPMPKAPELLMPEDSAEDVDPYAELIWRKAEFAEYYQLDFYNEAGEAILRSEVHDTTYEFEEPLANKSLYRWHVKSVNYIGSSGFSEAFSFTTGVIAPDAPKLTAPADEEEHFPLDSFLRWEEVQEATSYIVQVSENQNFNNNEIDEKTTDTYYRITELLEKATDYHWRVKAKIEDVEGDWSETWKFTTVDVPGAPSPYSPGEGVEINSAKVTLSWETPEIARMFIVSFGKDSTITNNQQYVNITDKYYEPPVILTEYTKYYWAVKAVNSAGESDWSARRSFETGEITSVPEELQTKYNFSISPNPFQDRAVVSFELTDAAHVKLTVYELSGRTLAVLLNERVDAGFKTVDLKADELVSGSNIMILKINIDGEIYSAKVVRVR